MISITRLRLFLLKQSAAPRSLFGRIGWTTAIPLLIVTCSTNNNPAGLHYIEAHQHSLKSVDTATLADGILSSARPQRKSRTVLFPKRLLLGGWKGRSANSLLQFHLDSAQFKSLRQASQVRLALWADSAIAGNDGSTPSYVTTSLWKIDTSDTSADGAERNPPSPYDTAVVSEVETLTTNSDTGFVFWNMNQALLEAADTTGEVNILSLHLHFTQGTDTIVHRFLSNYGYGPSRPQLRWEEGSETDTAYAVASAFTVDAPSATSLRMANFISDRVVFEIGTSNFAGRIPESAALAHARAHFFLEPDGVLKEYGESPDSVSYQAGFSDATRDFPYGIKKYLPDLVSEMSFEVDVTDFLQRFQNRRVELDSVPPFYLVLMANERSEYFSQFVLKDSLVLDLVFVKD